MLMLRASERKCPMPADSRKDDSFVLSVQSMNDLENQNRRYLDPGAFNQNFELLELSCVPA